MKLFTPFLLILLLLSSTLFATNSPKIAEENTLAVFYKIDGDIQNSYEKFIKKDLKTIGFNLTSSHKHINKEYKKKYPSSVFDALSFFPLVNDNIILPLLNVDPRIAGFAPFNMLMYKNVNEDTTYIGHLHPQAMLDILGIKNKTITEEFVGSFTTLDKEIEEKFSGKKSLIPYTKLPKQKMFHFEYSFKAPKIKAPKDRTAFIKNFQNKLKSALSKEQYLILGEHNFLKSSEHAEKILSGYDSFWTYSLSHVDFSYNIFDGKEAKAETALFAPFNIYIYIKKGSNKIIVGMSKLNNAIKSLNITSAKRLALINKLDNKIPKILKGLGMKDMINKAIIKEVVAKEIIAKKEVAKKVLAKKVISTKSNQDNYQITIPTVPRAIKPISPPKAIKVKGGTDMNRAIKFSKRVPPNYVPHSFDKRKKVKQNPNTLIGEVYHGRISAHLRGEYMNIKEVETRLKNAGFKVLSKKPVNKKKSLISIVFTDDSLIEMASKPNRGFMASLRVLIDKKKKRISITNPLYMAKGFLQDDFDEKKSKALLVKLISEFPKLKNAKDALKFQLLPNYQFMNGMPHYQDMIEVASGDALLERLKKNKRVIFQQKLNNGTTLIGIKLGKRTRKFTKRIGTNNAGMLPYPVLIQEGKALILDPKYYISFMYPLLQMSEFMTIASIPDAMIKDARRVFKKKKSKK